MGPVTGSPYIGAPEDIFFPCDPTMSNAHTRQSQHQSHRPASPHSKEPSYADSPSPPSHRHAQAMAEAPPSPPLHNDGSNRLLAVLTYRHTGDNGGYIYWLGTLDKTRPFKNPHEEGLIRITSSGMPPGRYHREGLIEDANPTLAWPSKVIRGPY